MQTTLSARYYCDPAYFAAEMEQLFFRRWFAAGHVSSIEQPGDYFLCQLGAESVIVTRNDEGLVQAFFNVCRHRGTRLCEAATGHLQDRIQCGYHAWTYDLSGKLLAAPRMQDLPGFRREEYALRKVNVDVWDGHIFLNFADRPPPLRHQLHDLPEKFSAWRMHELRSTHRIVYDVTANWKLLVLNYNECLHCPVLHPMLNRLTNYLAAENEVPHAAYIGGSMGFRDDVETMSVDGRRRRDYLPGIAGDDRERVCYYVVYPNLFLSLHPDYVLTHTLWPEAPNRTRIVCDWFFHPDQIASAGFSADDVIEFWDVTNREDWHITELSQQGIGSRGYTPGPYSDREALLHAFDRWVVTEMGPDSAL